MSELFDVNADHPGLKAAMDYLSQLMVQAAANERSFPSAPELARLVRSGITARDVLREVCAFWSWQQHNTRALPTDKAWDFAMSRAVFGLFPRPRRVTNMGTSRGSEYSTKPRHSALAHLGAHLRAALGSLLVTVSSAVELRKSAVKATMAALSAPLVQPSAVFIAEQAAAAAPILKAASDGLANSYPFPSSTQD